MYYFLRPAFACLSMFIFSNVLSVHNQAIFF